MRSGLEVLLSDKLDLVKGLRVGLCCNHTAVDRDLNHAIDRLVGAGVPLVRLFGPEHGVRATAQDMETVSEHKDPVTGLPTVSLYGTTEASLRPDPATLADLDVLLFDVQDIGARYYTYQATLGFLMEACGQLGKRVIVLDRPNPIDGVTLEGNVVQPGFESFVGAFPIAVRHGMTVGELALFFGESCEVECDVEIVPCEGWDRSKWFDELDLPWVFPSPNMPTLDTAAVYPGTCLIEATNISEGRGTTRPFHRIGAPWLDPQRFARECAEGAARAGLSGVRFRPDAFVPGFQKHAGKGCGGVEVHVRDRRAMNAFLLGMVVTEAARNCDPERFAWRAEPYEFVSDPPAIDLLTGSAEYRTALEAGAPIRDILDVWKPQLAAFAEQRRSCLLYGEG